MTVKGIGYHKQSSRVQTREREILTFAVVGSAPTVVVQQFGDKGDRQIHKIRLPNLGICGICTAENVRRFDCERPRPDEPRRTGGAAHRRQRVKLCVDGSFGGDPVKVWCEGRFVPRVHELGIGTDVSPAPCTFQESARRCQACKSRLSRYTKGEIDMGRNFGSEGGIMDGSVRRGHDPQSSVNRKTKLGFCGAVPVADVATVALTRIAVNPSMVYCPGFMQ